MARIPSVVTNQGEETRILSEERRKKWISAISRKDLTDSILEHGRVCGRHFISGKAAKLWDRYDPDWIPTQNLGHNKCDAAEKLQADLEAAGKRDERVRDREMKRVAAENEKRLREEIEAKRQKIGDPGEKVSDISFNSDSAMEVHTLRVPHFRQHDNLACDHMPLHVVNKPRNHLVVSFQTAKGFKLLLRVKAGLKNQITE